MNTKKIGVWGLGIVGKSVITFLQQYQITPSVLAQQYTSTDIDYLMEHNIPYYTQDKTADFLEKQDIIIPSPGIDLRPYAQYAHKWLVEADIFQHYNTTPLIAITGTIGKTSLTHLLGQLLNTAQKKTSIGGNIGTGMLDLLYQENNYFVLELSSFQLEHTKTFAPDLAVITNIYPNHLDRHTTFEQYKQAKYTIFAQQHKTQHAMLPLELYQSVTTLFPHRTFSFFSLTEPPLLDASMKMHTYYYIKNNIVIKKTNSHEQSIIDTAHFPPLSFIENWLILTSILDILSLDISSIIQQKRVYDLPNHRIDSPLLCDGILFYNDSKSTLMQATIAAVDKTATKPILLLGGLSKDVDRIPLLPVLKNRVKALVCFGKEAPLLAKAAATIDIPASAHATLDEAFNSALIHAQKGDCILLSPGGSSHDLFSNYKERGAYFEELIKKYGAQRC